MVCVTFSQGSFEMYFHVQIKQSCKSGRLVAFFWYKYGPEGDWQIWNIHIFNGWEKYLGAPGEVYSWCVALVVAADLLNFAVTLYFLTVYWLQSKGGWAFSWLIGCSTNSIILRMLVRKGEKSLSFTPGMEFPIGMKLSFFPGKVVSVYLLTDRNYVSKSAVIMKFLYLLLTAWVEFLSEWYPSFRESRE